MAGTTNQIPFDKAISGTVDWTLQTYTFTSDNDAAFLEIYFNTYPAGNVSDFWLDVNSMTLIETGVVRNPVV